MKKVIDGKHCDTPYDGTLRAEREWINLCNRTPGHMATVLHNPVYYTMFS